MQRRRYIKHMMLMTAGAYASLGYAKIDQHSNNKDIIRTSSRLWERVWDTRRQRWLDTEAVIKTLLAADHIIIGERHDNIRHHEIERWVIQLLIAYQRLGGVAMEMLLPRQQTLIEAKPYSFWQNLNDSALQQALDWQPGWQWAHYGDIVKLTLNQNLPLIAANVDTTVLKSIMATNAAPILPAAVADFQKTAIIDGHCGMLPESMVGGMMAVQVARDQAMAAALTSLADIGVLICGAGHARADIGVSRYAYTNTANNQAPTPKKPLTLGLMEAPDPYQAPHQVIPASVNEQPVFDLVWFTAPQQRNDPCQSLRARFGKT